MDAHKAGGASAIPSASASASASSSAAAAAKPDTVKFRTVGDAVSEVAYAWRYAQLNERFWRFIDTLLSVISALAGSATFAAAVSAPSDEAPWWRWIAPMTVAIASIAQLVFRPADRAGAFSLVRRDLYTLEVRAWSMSVTEINTEHRRLTADAPRGIRALAAVARNELVTANGSPHQAEPLSVWQRMLSLLA